MRNVTSLLLKRITQRKFKSCWQGPQSCSPNTMPGKAIKSCPPVFEACLHQQLMASQLLKFRFSQVSAKQLSKTTQSVYYITRLSYHVISWCVKLKKNLLWTLDSLFAIKASLEMHLLTQHQKSEPFLLDVFCFLFSFSSASYRFTTFAQSFRRRIEKALLSFILMMALWENCRQQQSQDY